MKGKEGAENLSKSAAKNKKRREAAKVLLTKVVISINDWLLEPSHSSEIRGLRSTKCLPYECLCM